MLHHYSGDVNVLSNVKSERILFRLVNNFEIYSAQVNDYCSISTILAQLTLDTKPAISNFIININIMTLIIKITVNVMVTRFIIFA